MEAFEPPAAFPVRATGNALVEARTRAAAGLGYKIPFTVYQEKDNIFLKWYAFI